MNEATTELFTALRETHESQSVDLGDYVRDVLGPELVSRMTPEQHQELVAELAYATHRAIGSVLNTVNNVGGVLDGPFHGYTIVGQSQTRAPEEVGDGYTDLRELWNDFYAPPSTKRMEAVLARIWKAVEDQKKSGKQ
jgi:hypothetical protein